MSEYKVSFNLLKQQIDELKTISTQMKNIAEKVLVASANLGQDELLSTARTSLINVSSNIGSKSELLAIASATLGEIIEEYTGTEKKNVTRAEGTRAHSRDFYKNPVVISDAAGEGLSGSAASAYTVAGAQVGYEAATAGATVGAAGAVAGAEVGAAGAVMGAEAGSAATLAGAEAATAAAAAGNAAGLGGVALGAGVAVAGAAVGAAGVAGGLKLSSLSKEKKAAKAQEQSNNQYLPQSPQDTNGVQEAEDALKKAKEKLNSIESDTVVFDYE